MAYLRRIILFSFLLALAWWLVESKRLNKKADVVLREKRSVNPLSVIGSAVKAATAIQGAVCTFTDVCGGDEVTQKLAQLEQKLDAIQSDVTSIKKDVEDIWDESKRKWYFRHIEYIVKERERVIRDLKNKDNSALAKDRRQRFINEVVGGAGNDAYVEKGLFFIPNLVSNERLVTHYFDVQIQNGQSTKEAARLTWRFIKKLFRYQEDGYATVVLASSMKYKNEEAAYNTSMAQVCTWWPKSKDPKYVKFCANYVKDPELQDRRKVQQDFLFGIRDLALVPVQLVQTDCDNFTDSDSLLYSAGFLYVAQPVAKKILVVDRETLEIVKTIDVPGDECGGACHPFGIAIDAQHKVMAVAAQSQLSGGESKVMMFKIKGNLDEPSGMSIEHFYTMSQLMKPSGSNPDVRGVAYCGERFAYADYNGAIYNWRMRWDDPQPNLWDRYDWYLDRELNTLRGNTYYLSCSNGGRNWVVEKTDNGFHSDGVGAVPSDSSARYTNKILDIAEGVVKREDWSDIQDLRPRMTLLKGTALDSKRNLFYSSGQLYPNSVSGVYQRTYDAKRRFVREWNKESKVKMFGMAVDDISTKRWIRQQMSS